MRRSATTLLLFLVACAPLGRLINPALHGRWVTQSTVTRAPGEWPKPLYAANAAHPHIETLWMNETKIRVGREWRGVIVTSTNVASVEVRTESFTFVAQRERPGFFTFSQEILDMVPQYRRPYTLSVIARNSNGVSDTWLVPIVLS